MGFAPQEAKLSASLMLPLLPVAQELGLLLSGLSVTKWELCFEQDNTESAKAPVNPAQFGSIPGEASSVLLGLCLALEKQREDAIFFTPALKPCLEDFGWMKSSLYNRYFPVHSKMSEIINEQSMDAGYKINIKSSLFLFFLIFKNLSLLLKVLNMSCFPLLIYIGNKQT